jgi:hypothetical protein
MISTCPQAQRLGIKTRQPLGHAQNSLTSAAPGIVDVARIVLVETDDEARRSNRARLLQLCLEAIRGSLLAARRVDLDALATQFVAKHPLLERRIAFERSSSERVLEQSGQEIAVVIALAVELPEAGGTTRHRRRHRRSSPISLSWKRAVAPSTRVAVKA